MFRNIRTIITFRNNQSRESEVSQVVKMSSLNLKLKPKPNSKLISSIVTRIAILTVLSLYFQSVQSSGVFEFELIRFQQHELPQSTNTNSTKSSDNSQNTKLQANQIFVCLKEPFTSQLDGPCTFGNSSINIRGDRLINYQKIEQSVNATTPTTIATTTTKLLSQNYIDNQASQLANLVRIPFTFRWTKSFTIILTGEQVHLDDPANNRGLTAQIKHLSSEAKFGTTTTPSNGLIEQLSGSLVSKKFIDRHVFIENEVVPSIFETLNDNKTWTIRSSRSLISTLEYKFRVYCSPNYYGDGCTTFCRPRDDHFGHFNCSNTGQKICLNGWEGLDCDKAKCRSGCNLQHGHCDKPDTCQCRPGWSGLRCDECITYPGCQNGYCLSPWQCVCQRNWGGVLCDQDLNYCGSHDPCKNNGTCQNIAPGKYKCHCQTGFSGVNCDINLNSLPANNTNSYENQINAGCALNPCLNGGTCFGFNRNFLSQQQKGEGGSITPGKSSSSSSYEMLNLEDSNADLTQEGPSVGDRIYRCQCSPGWTGDYCQWPDSGALAVTDILTIGSSSNVSTTPENNIIINGINNSRDLDNSDSIGDPLIEHNKESIEKLERYQPIFIENAQLHSSNHFEMRHLISGVVVATVTGVFFACLLFIWCCLMAVEKNRFSMIQMNFIRTPSTSSDPENQGQPVAIGSRLRRVQEKIRNSFRRSSTGGGRIKPETKLSIENVLRPPKPPPSYEESNYCKYPTTTINKLKTHKSNIVMSDSNNGNREEEGNSAVLTKQGLVIKETLERKLSTSNNTATPAPSSSKILTKQPNVNCPRHGHLYRDKGLNQKRQSHKKHHHNHNYNSHRHNPLPVETGSTCIEIISEPRRPTVN